MITQTFICLGTTTTQSEFRGLYPARVATPEEERTSGKHGKMFLMINYDAEKLNAPSETKMLGNHFKTFKSCFIILYEILHL